MIKENTKMPIYICSSEDREAWSLPPEEVKKQTFNTQEEAEQWFYLKYPGENIQFDGYITTIYLPTSYVSINGKEVGRITKKLDS